MGKCIVCGYEEERLFNGKCTACVCKAALTAEQIIENQTNELPTKYRDNSLSDAEFIKIIRKSGMFTKALLDVVQDSQENKTTINQPNVQPPTTPTNNNSSKNTDINSLPYRPVFRYGDIFYPLGEAKYNKLSEAQLDMLSKLHPNLSKDTLKEKYYFCWFMNEFNFTPEEVKKYQSAVEGFVSYEFKAIDLGNMGMCRECDEDKIRALGYKPASTHAGMLLYHKHYDI